MASDRTTGGRATPGDGEDPRSQNGPGEGASVIYVDLDGTFLRVDTLWEALLGLVRRHPGALPGCVRALVQGRAAFKAHVAARFVPDVAHMPVNPRVREFIEAQRAAGTHIVLATASDERVAEAVRSEFPVFDEVLASDGASNRKGAGKAAAIVDHARAGGWGRTTYLGDSRADLEVFPVVDRGIFLGRRPRFGLPANTEVLEPDVPQNTPRAMLRALRPWQWSKNLLLFIPLIAGHRWDPAALLATLVGFVALSLVASAGYLINDLLDLESDRRHPGKRFRPLAAGLVTVPAALVTAGILLAVSATLAAPFGGWVAGGLALYLAGTLTYSIRLKRMALLDALALSGLFVFRVFFGGLLGDVPVSEWLAAFSLFVFTSLAFVKRYAELARLQTERRTGLTSRGYLPEDDPLVQMLGVGSGLCATLTLALYINSGVVTELYAQPRVLWLMCPLLLYWIGHLWLAATRHEMNEDPILFAFRDRVSRWTLAAAAVVYLVATFAG